MIPSKTKEHLLEQLQKTPIVQIAVERVGIARSTFYRWKLEDKEFAKKVDDAVFEGQQLINDLAESKLIASIQDQNMSAIVFWLRTHNEKYRQKLELSGQLKHIQEELTPDQKKIVEQALKLSSIITEENIKKLASKNYDSNEKTDFKEDS